jgi:hypothetical protein
MRKPLGQLGGAIQRPLLRAATLFLLFSAANCNAQVSCISPYGFAYDPTTYWYNPNITSVSPSTWVAGKTYNITIGGTGLVDVPNPFRDPQTPTTGNGDGNCNLEVTLNNTGNVTLSNVSFVSPTLVTATVTLDASLPTQTACVTVSGITEMVIRQTVSASGVRQTASPDACPANTGGTTNPSPSSSAPVQIVGCLPPTITSVSPSTWFAGKSYKTTITGTGFITSANATAACPVTPVNITAADGSVVPVSDVNVASPTKITVTVAPDQNATTETASVTAGMAPNTSTPPTQAQILGNEIHCDPSMNCTQDVISTTDGSDPPVQNVVVGQPIKLTTNPNLPATITPYKTTWTVPTTPANIGAYTVAPDASSATVTPTELKEASLNTYWVYPNGSIPVTYQYCVNIPGAQPVKQCSLVANAAFNVTGPTATITPSATSWYVTPQMSCPSIIQFLYFGYPDPITGCSLKPFARSDAGISFNAALSNVPDSGGTTEWVQLILKESLSGVSLSGGPSIPAYYGPGLDNSYPYGPDDPNADVTTQASDSPNNSLNPLLSRETRRFKADMYYLWKPQISGSIFVPLGYVEWSTSGTGVQHTKDSPPWSLASSGATTAMFHASSDTGNAHGYPTWSGVVGNTNSNSNENDDEGEELEEQQ